MREPTPPRAGFQSYASPPGSTGTFTPLSLSSPSWNRQRGQACRRPWGNGQVTGYSIQPTGAGLPGETKAEREGDTASRRTHTGSASAESQEPPCRRGVVTPTSQLGRQRCRATRTPKAPSYHMPAPGFCLSCPVCRPHMLSGLCPVASPGALTWGGGHGHGGTGA